MKKTRIFKPSVDQLDSLHIVNTIERLKRRIGERFPGSGLSRVCNNFLGISKKTKSRIAWIEKPNIPLRVGIATFVAAAVISFIYSITLVDWNLDVDNGAEIIPLLEALLNDIILIGAALFFLFSIEVRIKRARSLEALHELRSIAHVIDMHQLTKDPSIVTSADPSLQTPSSPKREMTAFQLKRYLDYCSEMLSLVGKVAALYSTGFPDSEIVSAANDIEDLCTSLSRKVWQKIVVINADS
ncbi:hypothetical protein NBRC116493_13100 [Aurantivibrio infirmus]